MDTKMLDLDKANAISETLILESYLESDRHTAHWALGLDEWTN